MFGVDSEEEGDHDSSYDGPNSDAEDAADWEADEWQREIDEAEMEASGLEDRDRMAMGYYSGL